MKVFLTGAAGFIGFHTARRLLGRGDTVSGVDNLSDYYPVSLKHDRLALLEGHSGFAFFQADVAKHDTIDLLRHAARDANVIVHLAAQPGVRYSTKNPFAYIDANIAGQVAMLELAAKLPQRPPLVYASSSSVYGNAEPVPFAESSRADKPISVYAATKRAGELMAHAYGDLYGIQTTGLRLFTVYGSFGRPDMAPWLFTDAILKGEPISVYNNGEMRRDFTHVDDIVSGIVAAADRIIAKPHDIQPIYNLGNHTPVALLDFIHIIEHAAGRKVDMRMKPKPPGDVLETCADISLAQRDLGFNPSTRLRDGIPAFVDWFRSYTGQ